MNLSASNFRAYSLRRTVPSTINEDIARGLGPAFGTVTLIAGQTTVAVGRSATPR